MAISTLKKNYIYTLLRVFSSFLFPIITFPHLLRVLGPSKIGEVEYMLAVAQYSALISTLGISVYAVREIGIIRDDLSLLRKTFSELLVIRIINSIFVGLILFAVLYFTNTNSGLLVITLLYLILQIGVIDWFFQGIEEVKIITLRTILTRFIVLILIFSIVKNQSDYLWYYLLLTIDSIASLGYGCFYIFKHVGFQTKHLDFKRHFRPMLFLFGVQFSVSIYTILDKIMLGLFSSTTEVGYYTTALKLIKIVQTIVTSLGLVLLPRLSQYINTSDFESFKDLIRKSFNFIFLISIPLVVGIFITSDYVILLFAGEQYYKSIVLLKTLSIIILLVSLSNLFGVQVLLSIKREKEFSIVVGVGALINIILNVILIPQLNSLGASLATIITESLVTLGCIYFAYRYFDDLPKPEYRNIIKYCLLASTFILIDFILDEKNILYAVTSRVLLCSVIYLIGLYLIKDKILFQALNFFKKNKNEI